MNAGAKLDFGKAEVYWPQDDAASSQYQELLGLDAKPSAQDQSLVQPMFDAKVTINAQIDVLVTPEANMGLRIGGTITGGSPLVDAQLVGYVNTSLSFQASATASGGANNDATSTYSYGVYLFYNLGYGAFATIKSFPNWALQPRNAYNPTPRFTIYESTGSFSGITSNDKREFYHGHEPDLYSPSNRSSMLATSYLYDKRGDSSDEDPFQSQTPDFSQQLTCPTGDSSLIRLPDFRFNCGIFGDSQLNGNNGQIIVPGICSGIQSFLTRRGLANSDMVLTWDPNRERRVDRAAISCPKSSDGAYCTSQQSNLQAQTKDKTIAISCDEFPFASTEEGGGYLRTLASGATSSQSTCVPAWQQTLQGNCNRMLSSIQTNVAYYERAQRGDSAVNFVPWSTSPPSERWFTVGSTFNGQSITSQRVVSYPNQIPQATGISDTAYSGTAGAYGGYMFRRNFTFGLASPVSSQDGAAWVPSTGAAESWTFKNREFPPGIDGGDVQDIACAINTFGQDDIYSFPYNGLCFNGGYLSGRGFPTVKSFSGCIIEFAATPNNKRSIGQFHGWHVNSITMLDKTNITADVVKSSIAQ